MRQFDIDALNLDFKKDQIKSIDKQLNALVIEKNKINVRISLLMAQKEAIRETLNRSKKATENN